MAAVSTDTHSWVSPHLPNDSGFFQLWLGARDSEQCWGQRLKEARAEKASAVEIRGSIFKVSLRIAVENRQGWVEKGLRSSQKPPGTKDKSGLTWRWVWRSKGQGASLLSCQLGNMQKASLMHTSLSLLSHIESTCLNLAVPVSLSWSVVIKYTEWWTGIYSSQF